MKDEKLKALAENATPVDCVGKIISVLQFRNDEQWRIDCDYIVAACNETPKLLARIAALRAVLSHLPVHADYSGAVLNGLISDALAADDKAQGESSLWVCQTPKNR